jgi:hypothetical protein
MKIQSPHYLSGSAMEVPSATSLTVPPIAALETLSILRLRFQATVKRLQQLASTQSLCGQSFQQRILQRCKSDCDKIPSYSRWSLMIAESHQRALNCLGWGGILGSRDLRFLLETDSVT